MQPAQLKNGTLTSVSSGCDMCNIAVKELEAQIFLATQAQQCLEAILCKTGIFTTFRYKGCYFIYCNVANSSQLETLQGDIMLLPKACNDDHECLTWLAGCRV